ncbi:MAG TPA: chorismate mutase [Bacillota bacterium]|nr:chorismate mutase [Bacillota bacterium]
MEELRNQIDIIDQSIQNLFLERMGIVKKVALYKKENKLPIFDEKREKDIIAKNVSRIDDLDFFDLYEEFYKKMIEMSRKYQERIIGE